ncbi:Protein-associating with the domain of ezrin [Echinococcus granulosus]|uniref:Protein-associating with the domain of ezrin n=1 Tax=Echinococcus granulosus TaxID=6210 RepID=W6UTL6_ECHGR|nr:Protein-associating with the domain of ezrin [Echinococcus granulosus]EUB63981.1 Protein-associating with the domain of ezrin [Echinococcus granulosus]
MNDFQTVLERSGLHASPQQRPTAAHLLKHSAFKDPFAYIVSFLSDYVLKSDTERFHFFDELPKLARQISEEVFCSSIIPLILVPSVFTDFPAKPLVRHLLTPRKVVPYISRLFRCHELTTRLLLLQHFKAYARLMGYETLRAIILPEVHLSIHVHRHLNLFSSKQVCMGVYDVNEDLAVASLSGLAHLAHLLGITCTMGHFQSLGSQLENRGFLTTSLDPETSSAYHKLMVAPTKKPIAYCIAKRPWRRTRVTFYPDSSPKANRQAREASTETRNDTERRLCDMAVLSAKYVPTGVPAPIKEAKSESDYAFLLRNIFRNTQSLSGPFSNSYPSVSAEGVSPVKSAVLNVKDSSKQVILNGLGSPVPNVPEGKLPNVKEDSTVPPSKDLSSQSLTADNNDSDTDQWNDWTSDSEDDKLAAKASSSLSLKSSNFLSRTENELGESVTQVKAILEEIEPKTTSYSAVSSISQRGDLSSAAPLPSADGSLRYKVENAFGDSNDEGDEDEGGWSAEDDEF